MAGKMSGLMAFARKKSARVSQLFIGPPEKPDIAGLATWAEGQKTFEICTLPGGVWRPRAWLELATSGSKFVFFLDSRAERSDLAIMMLMNALQLGLGPVAAVQITNPNRPEGGSFDSGRLAASLVQLGIPTFISQVDSPETHVAAIEYVVSRWN